jgi:hypothetical protein
MSVPLCVFAAPTDNGAYNIRLGQVAGYTGLLSDSMSVSLCVVLVILLAGFEFHFNFRLLLFVIGKMKCGNAKFGFQFSARFFIMKNIYATISASWRFSVKMGWRSGGNFAAA